MEKGKERLMKRTKGRRNMKEGIKEEKIARRDKER